MSKHDWVVLMTKQMGNRTDDVFGPFDDEAEAQEFANAQLASSRKVGRFDRFEVGHVVIPGEE